MKDLKVFHDNNNYLLYIIYVVISLCVLIIRITINIIICLYNVYYYNYWPQLYCIIESYEYRYNHRFIYTFK